MKKYSYKQEYYIATLSTSPADYTTELYNILAISLFFVSFLYSISNRRESITFCFNR